MMGWARLAVTMAIIGRRAEKEKKDSIVVVVEVRLKKKKNGFEILEQEGMAHGFSSEHRERVESRAKARRRR